HLGVSLSNGTINLLASAFYGGEGFSHNEITRIWVLNGVPRYMAPDDGTIKRERVTFGLRWLRDGRQMPDDWLGLPPTDVKLRAVAAELANQLIRDQFMEREKIVEALARDGLELDGDTLVDARPVDGPADEIAEEVARLFGKPELDVARNHYEQAQ